MEKCGKRKKEKDELNFSVDLMDLEFFDLLLD
jgi:hypothetical protein